MSERGKGLTILTFLIGICGIGLGIYAIFFQPQQPSVVSNIWAVEQDGSYSPLGTYSDMPNMNVLITVNTGETVYGTFSALFTLSVADTWFNGGVWVLKDSVGMINS